MDCRDSSVFKSTGFSFRLPHSTSQPPFNSQHPHGSSAVSVTPVPGDLMPSSGLHRHQTCTQCTNIRAGKTAKYIKKNCSLLPYLPLVRRRGNKRLLILISWCCQIYSEENYPRPENHSLSSSWRGCWVYQRQKGMVLRMLIRAKLGFALCFKPFRDIGE